MDAVTKWKPSEIDSMLKLGKRVATLQEDIPCRDGGIPLGYVDSVELAKLSASDDPSLAIVPISFLEGFPTVNGVPIWERLDSEPLDMYDLFKCYLHLPATDGRRTFAAVASRAGIDVRAVTAIASLWHWTVRAAAYDQFKEMERQYIRQYEIRKMENEHAKAADKIFQTCMDFIEKHHKELTPKMALDWLKLSVELKRLSLGLSKDKPDGYCEHGGGSGHVININQTITPNGSEITNKEQDKDRIFQILSVLQQAGVFKGKILDVESEVVDIDASERGTETPEADHDTSDDEVHCGATDAKTGCLSLVR